MTLTLCDLGASSYKACPPVHLRGVLDHAFASVESNLTHTNGGHYEEGLRHLQNVEVGTILERWVGAELVDG
jgi:hypothetical protein